MKVLFSVASQLLVRIPECHLIEGDAELRPGVQAQMLVGEEEHLVELFQVNIKERNGVRRCTNDAFIPAAERLDRGRRIHVGDGSNLRIKNTDVAELLPSVLDLFDRRHIGHRATRAEIRQYHMLSWLS